MCAYLDNKLHAIDGPVFFYTHDTVPRTGETALTFQILNVEKSIAESLLIETVRSILRSSGYPQSSVRINTLGDQDSATRYTRELTNYLRKRLDELPPTARELMKEHPALALMHLIEKEHELAFRSPSPLEYLSDASRKHFREIVEYLDMSSAPYEIDSKLLGHYQCYSETIFSFDLRDENDMAPDTEPLMIRGGRYNAFTARMVKGGVPASGAVIVLKNQQSVPLGRPLKSPSPAVSIVQLGFGPKMRSLMILDQLRHAGIPVAQDLVSDSLSTQLRRAEERNTRFAVIIGQKEFVEQSVIVRDLHSRSQEIIPMSGLVNYLKRMIR
jgi:histidyl-tRNA synthetase